MHTHIITMPIVGERKSVKARQMTQHLVLVSVTVRSAALPSSVPHAGIFGPADCGPSQALENIC